MSKCTSDFFFLTSPGVVRRTFLSRSGPSQTSRSFSRTRTSTRPRPLLADAEDLVGHRDRPVDRDGPVHPVVSRAVLGHDAQVEGQGWSRGLALAKNRCAGGAMPRLWWGRLVL